MSVIYCKKDVTTVERGIVAHGVNCQGVMGSGVALSIRNKWPQAYSTYKMHCDSCFPNEPELGSASIASINDMSLYVSNCFTQRYYGRNGSVYANKDAVRDSLYKTLMVCEMMQLDLYMPLIGCGLGGLSWDADVAPIITALALDFPEVNIYVCTV